MKAMKTFFIWLLLSFIPLQGISANTLLTCKAANPGTMQSHADVADEALAHPCAQFEGADAHAPIDPDDSHEPSQKADAGCVAHYVSASWLPTAELAMPSIDPLPERIAFAAFQLSFFIPDGPERPPRRLFL